MQLRNLRPVSGDQNEAMILVQQLSRTGEIAGRIASASFETANLILDNHYEPVAIGEGDRPHGLPSTADRLAQFMIEDFERFRAAWPELEKVVRPAIGSSAESSRMAMVNHLLKILMKINPCYMICFSDLYLQAISNGYVQKLINNLEEAAAAWPEPAMQMVFQHPYQEIISRGRQIQSAADMGIPGILFNTMPKSGSMFISNGLCQGLGTTYLPIALATHPLRDRVVTAWAKGLVRGGAVSQEHIPATPQNIRALTTAGIKKIIVHLREPRQALLSNLHHVTNRKEEMQTVMEPFLPDDFWQRPFENRAEWMIDHYFGELLQWIEGWLYVAENPEIGIEVRFTFYEDLHGRAEKIYQTVLDHYGIPIDRFNEPTQIEKSEKTHFRKGLIDEWRESFTPGQQERLNSLIPDRFFDRFGWPSS